MLSNEIHSWDRRLIAEALAELAGDPTEMETLREKRAWELVWMISSIEGLTPDDLLVQNEDVEGFTDNHLPVSYLLPPRLQRETIGKNLLPWSYKYQTTMASWSKSDLKDVIAYFEEAFDWEFDIDNFDDRFRLQKYVYFAREFGLDVPYEYNIYRHGPYSPSLAEDYYEISGTGDSNRAAAKLDTVSFEELVENRGNDWLEVAATIHKMTRNFEAFKPSKNNTGEIINRVSNMKEEPEEKVRRIYRELYGTL